MKFGKFITVIAFCLSLMLTTGISNSFADGDKLEGGGNQIKEGMEIPEPTYVDVYRVRTYVIVKDLEKVLAGIRSATDLKYGNYDTVSWASAPGVERCVPLAGNNTYAGKKNELYKAMDSVKVEFSIPRDKELLTKVVKAIFKVHPWDEPVIVINESQETRKNGVI